MSPARPTAGRVLPLLRRQFELAKVPVPQDPQEKDLRDRLRTVDRTLAALRAREFMEFALSQPENVGTSLEEFETELDSLDAFIQTNRAALESTQLLGAAKMLRKWAAKQRLTLVANSRAAVQAVETGALDRTSWMWQTQTKQQRETELQAAGFTVTPEIRLFLDSPNFTIGKLNNMLGRAALPLTSALSKQEIKRATWAIPSENNRLDKNFPPTNLFLRDIARPVLFPEQFAPLEITASRAITTRMGFLDPLEFAIDFRQAETLQGELDSGTLPPGITQEQIDGRLITQRRFQTITIE